MTRRLPAASTLSRCWTVPVLLAVAGCGAGWHQPNPDELVRIPARQQVEVWHSGVAEHWHAVRVSGDSISGIRFTLHPNCDNCRVSLPRAQVDSVRFGDPIASFIKTYLLVVGVSGAVMFAICTRGCPMGGT